MMALVSYVLGEHWTEPELLDLVITSDGYAIEYTEQGDALFSSVQDLERNWTSLLQAAELTDPEKAEAEALFRSKVTDYRRSSPSV